MGAVMILLLEKTGKEAIGGEGGRGANDFSFPVRRWGMRHSPPLKPVCPGGKEV